MSRATAQRLVIIGSRSPPSSRSTNVPAAGSPLRNTPTRRLPASRSRSPSRWMTSRSSSLGTAASRSSSAGDALRNVAPRPTRNATTERHQEHMGRGGILTSGNRIGVISPAGVRLFALLACSLPLVVFAVAAPPPQNAPDYVTTAPIGPAYAANDVNHVSFRQNSLTSVQVGSDT